MRINLKHVFVLVTFSCILVSICSSFVNREKRIEKAIILLGDANENRLNPTKTSRAFRYLREIGVNETKMALHRMESDSGIRVHLRRSLNFLFELPSGIGNINYDVVHSNVVYSNVVYSNGLLFQGAQELYPFEGYSPWSSGNLKFSEYTFLPSNDLLDACNNATVELKKREAYFETGDCFSDHYVDIQLMKSIEHLLPDGMVAPSRAHDARAGREFLESASVVWDDESGRYELQTEKKGLRSKASTAQSGK